MFVISALHLQYEIQYLLYFDPPVFIWEPVGVFFFSCRILRKLPEPIRDGDAVPLHHLIMAFFRARAERAYQSSDVFTRILRRMVHKFCQSVEIAIEPKLMSTCPQPMRGAKLKVHPHSKDSRLRGSKALQMQVIERFQARSAGFVTTKDMSLMELGVRDGKSFGARTSAEYCCRLLAKGVEFFSQYEQKTEWKTLNFCLDLASVCHEHVLWLAMSYNYWVENLCGFNCYCCNSGFRFWYFQIINQFLGC